MKRDWKQDLEDIDALTEVVRMLRLFPNTPGIAERLAENLVTMAQYARGIIAEVSGSARSAP